ncbi:sigma-54 interaction domain-containing protein [Quatrionicoccus australiensis]|uniref:sigma-54 interaction domain-containing protein n=1 Tax=Quatrionicoccus australiensis TaxID=138118 RepID=UPI001CF85E34|nr:sigma 54-interacting transcriptional regulator [Quatrionicoccus australiensis]UCV14787.1 sigma 54-interacting transcriptional regulator [Quatrionicoccus australiensis]
MTTREELQLLANQSLLAHFADVCAGVVIVDASANVVWMNDHYPRRLHIADPAAMIGQPVEKIIPNSQMRQVVECGRPIMLDVMDFEGDSFVVTRLPLRNAEGTVVGGVGFMIFDDLRHLAPVVSRYQKLRLDLAEAERKLADARRTKYTFSSFIGAGPACSSLKQAARRASRTSSSVLILGETGTGKELLAQAVHAASPRANGPFVAVNIAAVPENLLEAEFFGVAPGAFTGAERRGRDGKFKLADGGTLFLDEIGDMSLALQAKLLRALQEREFEPVGSNKLIAVDVRIIAATSRNLEEMVAAGSFRADLYYRLNVILLRTPALRDRPEDMALLAEHLIESICRLQGMAPHGISLAALSRLQQHDWPGNVRELANVLERALLMSDGDVLEAEDLDLVMPKPKAPANFAGANVIGIAEAVASAERAAILAALRNSHGNKVQAARLLGISRAALYEKIAILGVDAHAA